MRRAFAVLVGAMICVTAAAQSNEKLIQHAAETVAGLHDSMLDPASFVLDGVYITKPHDIRERKNGGWSKGPVVAHYVSLCYKYRSHNRMGGYGEGSFFEDGGDFKKLPLLTTIEDPNAKIPSYNSGIRTAMGGDDCAPNHIGKDITPDVAALASTLYQKAK